MPDPMLSDEHKATIRSALMIARSKYIYYDPIMASLMSLDEMRAKHDGFVAALAALESHTQPVPNAAGGAQREALAEYAHEAWAGWMKYMFSKGHFESRLATGGNLTAKEQVYIMPGWAVERWSRQMNTPYADLPEEEKASDRKEADKMLAICSVPNAAGGQWMPVDHVGDGLDGVHADEIAITIGYEDTALATFAWPEDGNNYRICRLTDEPQPPIVSSDEAMREQLQVANDRLAELWTQLTRAKVQYEPVPFLEVDHDDPMQVKDGIALYKDWDSSEWFSLFPDGIMVMQRRQVADAPQVGRPDWSQANGWAQWWCVDANGECVWWETEPEIRTKTAIWFTSAGRYAVAGRIDIPIGIDWRTLKAQCPQ